jgi:hypothetical protein
MIPAGAARRGARDASRVCPRADRRPRLRSECDLGAERRRRDGLVYFGGNFNVTTVVTNLANDNSLTSFATGDGTLTILILTTGNEVLYGEDGKVIARNPGQVRVEILIDHGGTPTDPTDDEFLEFLGVVKDSTGRNDDFCKPAVPILLED